MGCLGKCWKYREDKTPNTALGVAAAPSERHQGKYAAEYRLADRQIEDSVYCSLFNETISSMFVTPLFLKTK